MVPNKYEGFVDPFAFISQNKLGYFSGFFEVWLNATMLNNKNRGRSADLIFIFNKSGFGGYNAIAIQRYLIRRLVLHRYLLLMHGIMAP
jgi:hypothetical protein